MRAGKFLFSIKEQKGLRFDASYHMSEGLMVRRMITSSPYELLTIKDVSNDVFYGIRAKRVYVTEKAFGIPFLSSSDILKADLNRIKLASKRLTPGVEQMSLQEGWTLISRSGTIGNCSFANAKHAQKLASEDVIRLVPNNILRGGLVFAYLASKYGYSLLTQGTFGGVIQHIEPSFVESLPIPRFPDTFQNLVNELVLNSARLRVEAMKELDEADKILKGKAELSELNTDNFDYYGHRNNKRKVSCFSRKISEVGSVTINAFNHSERIRNIKANLNCSTLSLKDVLLGNNTFSTGSFPRVEVPEGHGIMLINQKDIFDNIIKGKCISKRGVKADNLVEYGEVLIAGVGTLGENETFCRTIFANEDLKDQLISGEFIRMKTIDDVPSGYLYAWLGSDYGFRLLRNIQAGTKLCRPIPKLLLELPVPIIDKDSMLEIDCLVREAHTKRHQANQMELKAIKMVEEEIEKWNN